MKTKYWKKKKMYEVLCHDFLDTCMIELPKLKYCSYRFFRGSEWLGFAFEVRFNLECRLVFYKTASYGRVAVYDIDSSSLRYLDLSFQIDLDGCICYDSLRVWNRDVADALGFH